MQTMNQYRIIIILLFSTKLFSQLTTGQPVKLTLENCLRIGIEKNLNLKQSELLLKLQEVNLKESKFRQLPNLHASTNFGLSIGRNIDPTTNTFVTENILFGNYGLSSSVLLFQSGLLKNTIKLNEVNKSIAEKNYEQAVNDIGLQISTYYLNVLFAEDRLEASQKNLQTLVVQSNNMQKLVDIGSRAAADALELRAQEIRAEQSVVIAENNLEQAKLQLLQILKMDSSQDIELEKVSDSEFRNIENESYTAESLYLIAEKNQPGIQAAEKNVKAASLQQSIARSSYFPSLSGFGNINSRYSDAAVRPIEFGLRTDTFTAKVEGVPVTIALDNPVVTKTSVISFGDQFDQFLGYNFGLSLNIPIYNNYSSKAGVKRAEIQLEQSKLNLDIEKENLRLRVTQAVANVKAAIKELEASKKSLELAQLVLENTTKKFGLGSANSFELTVAQNNFVSAQISNTIARYDLLFKQKILELYACKLIFRK